MLTIADVPALNGSPGKVLVVGPSWVGDMVMSQPLYHYLKYEALVGAIDVLAPAWSAPLLERMPEVRRAIPMPLGHGEFGFLRRRQLGRSLRGEDYRQAIVLPNSWKSALVPLFANIPRRTGWRGEMRNGLLNDLRYLDERHLPLMVQRFLALATDATAPAPPVRPPELHSGADAARAAAFRFGIDPDRSLLALCPGAEFGAAKCWPPEYFAALAGQYLERGWQLILLGSGNDHATCDAVVQALGGANPGSAACFNLAGQTSLGEAVDLLSLAAAVVTNDSGLMHIAAALGRPVLAIYGATSADFTPPLGARAAFVSSDIDCAPCFQRQCPLGHHRCMREMTVSQVATRLADLLACEGQAAGGGV